MTQAELDALPEDSVGFGVREEVRDGKRVHVPVFSGTVGALYIGPHDGAVTDGEGHRWMVGWANGVRYKRRLPPLG